MATRKTRYAVDPSLQFNKPPDPQSGGQNQYQQQPYANNGGLHQQPYSLAEPGAYDSNRPRERSWASDLEPYPIQAPQAEIPPAQASNHPQPPTNHIPQPPHSAGPSLRGPKPRVDPFQVPSPVEQQEMDQNLYDKEDFLTCDTKGLVPMGTTDVRCVDQGNSIPRFIRNSLTHTPATSSLLETSQLPFGLVIQPFAPKRYDEDDVPLIQGFGFGEAGTGTGDDAGGGEPPRCSKCRGYVSPWARWIDGGSKWTCPLCSHPNPVHPSHHSHLDHQGVRLDIQDRPELRFGTVDFEVGEKYWAENPRGVDGLLDAGLSGAGTGDLIASLSEAVANTNINLIGTGGPSTGSMLIDPPSSSTSTSTSYSNGNGNRKARLAADARKTTTNSNSNARRPLPIARVYALDVSWSAGRSGVLRAVCEGIREGLYGPRKVDGQGGSGVHAVNGEEGEQGEEGEWDISPGRIGIVTFDRAVQFYDLSPGSERPQMMVVSDLEDMFVPLHTGFLVDPVASRRQIEGLLDTLPSIYNESPSGQVALGAAAKGVLAGLAQQGGQLSIFLTSLPNTGPGKLGSREDPKILGTEKEKALYNPADPFWRNTAEELAEAGVGVNVFFFPDRYTDVASVGILAGVTGGNVYFHPRFDTVRDRERLTSEIRRTLSPDIVYNATVRVRCSNGLRVSGYTGNYHQRSLTDLEFGIIDSDKAFSAVIKHEGKLDEREAAYYQAAILYTTACGQRRVRLMNLSTPVTNHIGNVFRFADFDTGIIVMLQEAVSLAPQKGLSESRKALTERCVRVLLMYRKHCAAATPSGQLILPDVYKLMPLYALCMIKSKALKGGHVSSDVRSIYLRALRSMSLPRAMTFLYPRMCSIHDMPQHVGYLSEETGRLELPTFMRASYAYMVAEGAYVLCNGEIAILWLGSAVSPQILSDVYGVEDLEEVDTRITSLPKIPSHLSVQLRNIMAHLERVGGTELPVIIARQNVDGTEVEFANMLFEDSNNDALPYAECE